MRQNPSFVLSDTDDIKQLIRENPWATIVSTTAAGRRWPRTTPSSSTRRRRRSSSSAMSAAPTTCCTSLGEHEILMIVQGPHGYISPGWYDADPAVPTWNFVTAHLTGTPEILTPEENLRALADLVDRFEEVLPDPRRMEGTPEDAAYAARISSGTVGFRLRATRIVAKRKMSQNKPPAIVDRILAELDGDGPYASAPLAREMRRARRDAR